MVPSVPWPGSAVSTHRLLLVSGSTSTFDWPAVGRAYAGLTRAATRATALISAKRIAWNLARFTIIQSPTRRCPGHPVHRTAALQGAAPGVAGLQLCKLRPLAYGIQHSERERARQARTTWRHGGVVATRPYAKGWPYRSRWATSPSGLRCFLPRPTASTG